MKTLTVPAKQGNWLALSRFPNFHRSGNIAGMKRRYYGKDALLVRSGAYIYHVDQKTYDQAKVAANWSKRR